MLLAVLYLSATKWLLKFHCAVDFSPSALQRVFAHVHWGHDWNSVRSAINKHHGWPTYGTIRKWSSLKIEQYRENRGMLRSYSCSRLSILSECSPWSCSYIFSDSFPQLPFVISKVVSEMLFKPSQFLAQISGIVAHSAWAAWRIDFASPTDTDAFLNQKFRITIAWTC